VAAGERQSGASSPAVAHAFAAAIGGVGGASAASVIAALVARAGSPMVRFASAVLAGASVAALGVAALMP